jgi:hypothetical protein
MMVTMFDTKKLKGLKPKEKKCFMTDHEVQWAGDGYFCSKCGIRFITEQTIFENKTPLDYPKKQVTPPQEAEDIEKQIAIKLTDIAIAARDNPKNVPIPRVLKEIMDLLQEQKEKVVNEEKRRIAIELLSIGKRYTDNSKYRKTDSFHILGKKFDVFFSTLASEEKENL